MLGVANTRVLAVDPNGTLRWQRQEAAGIAGVAVTTDDQLLVAAGAELAAYGRDGTRTRVIALRNDVFVTAPASGDDGELFIAGQRCLYRIY